MTETQNRRSRLIVNPAVQSRIIVNISWPSATALAVAALLLGWFSMHLLDEALVAQVELPSLIPVLLTVVAFLVVSFGYMVFNALKFSHRIAGPMYRLQKTLEAATEGDYSVRAKLRTNDFLVEVADSLNDFMDHLELQAGGLELGDGALGDVADGVANELAAEPAGVAGVVAGSAGLVAEAGVSAVTGAEATVDGVEAAASSEISAAAFDGSSTEGCPVVTDLSGASGEAESVGPAGLDSRAIAGSQTRDSASDSVAGSAVGPSTQAELETKSSGAARGPQGLGSWPRISVDDLPGALPVDADREDLAKEDESGLHLGVTATSDSGGVAMTESGSRPLPGPIGGGRRGRKGR